MEKGSRLSGAGDRREPFSVGTDNDGAQWIRRGDCNRCGECCSSGNPITGDPREPCPLLRRHADGVTSCSDRASHLYLNGCDQWPTIPQHIENYPSCSYRFERA